jgi:hypothetical protein
MGPINLGPINVFIGANNAGKSSILRGIYLMQQGSESGVPDVRVGSTAAAIELVISDMADSPVWWQFEDGKLTINIVSSDRRSGQVTYSLTQSNGSSQAMAPIPAVEPNHFVVPYLSKRKTAAYQEDVRNQNALQVIPNMGFLAAKLSRISNPSFPGHAEYSETCKAILGFMVTSVPSDSGQRPGVYLPTRETIPIDQMGEGVPNIVTLLADLALSRGKMFLIEEPENDLHPTALKALLDLIIESSKVNQFVISTHSHIVLRHLGALPSCLMYEVNALPGKLPVEAEVHLIEPSAEARLKVLRDLGYSFSDFDLWDGWLILEEASAERIIRDYLIPWFAPKLTRVRTLSTNGAGNVGPTFEDFHRLVRFTHLERAYTNSAWVRIDGDEVGKEVVDKLRKAYSTWSPDRFACFENPQFEHYYPSEFGERVKQVLSIADKKERRSAKKILLDDVRKWLDADTGRAQAALLESAPEIIKDLQKIELQLVS